MAKAFISHSTRDREFVEQEIIPTLAGRGIDFWYCKDDIQSAEQWDRSIMQGLRTCDWFLLVMSPNAEKSEWVKDEVLWAIEHRPQRLIPVLASRCDPREINLRLARIQYVNYLDPQSGRDQMLRCFDPDRVEAENLAPDASYSPVPSRPEATLSETLLGYGFLILFCPAITITSVLGLRWLLAYPVGWVGIDGVGGTGPWIFVGGILGLGLTIYCIKLEINKWRRG
jgi:hypothetical protein